MNHFGKHIQLFLSLLVAVGLAFSTVHFHGDDHYHIDGIELHVSAETNDCAICASHFKFTSNTKLDSEQLHVSEDLVFIHSDNTFVDPLNNSQFGRAPPISG